MDFGGAGPHNCKSQFLKNCKISFPRKIDRQTDRQIDIYRDIDIVSPIGSVSLENND